MTDRRGDPLASWSTNSPKKRPLAIVTLGTRLKPNVVPDWIIPYGNNSRRNNFVGNTTGTSVAGQITRSITMSFQVRK